MTGTERLLEVCRRTIDPHATAIRCHGTRVLRAATRLGEVIVKLHHRPERHQQELHAYQRWVPSLGDRAPRLLATTHDPLTLMVTAVPGQLLAGCNLAPGVERDAHRQAGAILRDLHAAGPPRRLPDMTAWLRERGMAWLEVARDIIPDDRRAEIAEHLEALRQLSPIPAVPCHLDFTPGNLLREEDGPLRIIDFEHTRYDLAARDLVRFTVRTWIDRPDLEEAFQTTYGALTDLDRQVITHARHLDDLTRTARAHGVVPGLHQPHVGQEPVQDVTPKADGATGNRATLQQR
jgi:Ser/Thr protein kinase RdoA (MazF antagonist)